MLRPPIAWFGDAVLTVEAGGQAGLANVWAVSDDYFAALQPRPALGRLLDTNAAGRGGPDTAVLGHLFWQRRFGGASDVIGRMLRVEGRPFLVTGVTEAGFNGLTVAVAPDVTVRLSALPSLDEGGAAGIRLSDPAWLGLDVGGAWRPA